LIFLAFALDKYILCIVGFVFKLITISVLDIIRLIINLYDLNFFEFTKLI